MTYLFLGLAVLVALILLINWMLNAQPRNVLSVLRPLALAGLLGLGVLFAATGRLGLLLGLAPFLLPLIMRGNWLRNRMKAARGPSQGATSEVRTRYVRMTLDHDSGEMDGEVLLGPNAGRRLSEMPTAEIAALYVEAETEDADSAQVLEAYLDRMRDWQGAAGEEESAAGAESAGARTRSGPMTIDEAYKVLGLHVGASIDEIKRAHRRLMQQVHPDRGGSDYLAARINEAKDVLLAGR